MTSLLKHIFSLLVAQWHHILGVTNHSNGHHAPAHHSSGHPGHPAGYLHQHEHTPS